MPPFGEASQIHEQEGEMQMINRSLTAIIYVVALAMVGESGSAGEYVWARSQFMSGPLRPVSVMGNGYGGYYVPRNAYGNNYEGKRFTNPGGFIIPAQTMPVR